MTQKARPALAPLTPAERIESLLDAAMVYELRRRAGERQVALLMDWGFADAVVDKVSRDAAEAEVLAEDALVEQLRGLIADGILDRCAELLRRHSGDDR